MPGTLEQLEFLKSSIAARIKGVNSRRLHYRSTAFYASISTAILSGTTTVILGLRAGPEWTEKIRIISLVITTIITLINTYNAFFNHKDLWVANNNALNKFYELRFDIEYFEKSAPPIDMNLICEFKKRYQSILDELNEAWSKSRAKPS